MDATQSFGVTMISEVPSNSQLTLEVFDLKKTILVVKTTMLNDVFR